MKLLVGFAVGYFVGARAGSQGFERVERAVRDVRESEEFQGFLAELQVHLRETARTVGELVRR